MNPDHPIFRAAISCLLALVGAASPAPIDQGPVPRHKVTRAARIFPDYAGIVVPPNIAPLNFSVRESGAEYHITVRSLVGDSIAIHTRHDTIRFPAGAWRQLLKANAGNDYYVDIETRDADSGWQRFTTITNHIATEPIDSRLVYRLIRPLYNYFREVGIYQRDLEGFDEIPVLDGRSFGDGCVNCHTFNRNSPATMAVNVRSRDYGRPLIIVNNGQVQRIPHTAGYLSWHPSGELLAYSRNKLSLFFHTVGENRDVFDAESDLAIYDVGTGTVALPEFIADPARLETWPEWGPAGRFLYYSSCSPRPFAEFSEVRYDLMRVAYDHPTRAWGDVETVLAAAETGLSATQPKVSPDGRYLLFCLSDYGSFPVYQPSSDLCLMDLAAREWHRLECNSDQCESWHCWSSNSRWIVFSSKRLDHVFARPHFSFISPSGHASKPFVLPQRDPAFYDSFIKTYNVPQLVTGAIRVSPETLTEAIRNVPASPQ